MAIQQGQQTSPITSQRRLQQLVVGLVLFNVVMVLSYAFLPRQPGFGGGMLIPGLLIAYNLLICQLVRRRARRSGDVAVIYIGTLTCIAACAVLLYSFFRQ
ncbi:MAG: hypothetical protein RBS88_09125 [Spongiibacteraceae bacterium]|nr:hypothetical protein [Spongiibacteraceae bacterium]